MRCSRPLLSLVVALGLAAGCVERALPHGGELDCSRVIFDPQVPAEMCGTRDRCDITGTLADGRALRQTCTQSGCALFVDGEQVCTCPAARLDWANTCYTGPPTCMGWLVNYVTIELCAAP
jgi:hypothetical protein